MEYVINMLFVNVKKDTQVLIVLKLYVRIIVIIMEFAIIKNVNVLEDFKDQNVNSQLALISVLYNLC
jgi:hypothetical protein